MWPSHMKFEHPPQQLSGQENDFIAFHRGAVARNSHHSQPHTMPSTPTHGHRRGQSLSALNAPRTPNRAIHPLRPPVYLQSPMSANGNGLVGVGDLFLPPSRSFQGDMAYYSPAIHSPGTTLENLNEEIVHFDLTGFSGPLAGGDSLLDSPIPSSGHVTPVFPFNNQNPFTSPPEALIAPRTASPPHNGLPTEHQSTAPSMQSFRTPQQSPMRHPFRGTILSTPDLSPTHNNPLKDALLHARQPSPSRESYMECLIRTPEPSPTRHSFSHPNPMHTAPDLRPNMTPHAGSQSPNRSRNSPSPSRRMRAHQRTQSLASVNSVASLADGDMEQYRVESNVKPEQISELIGEMDSAAPTPGGSPEAGSASEGAAAGSTVSGGEANKKFICKWLEANKDTGEEKLCGQFFERKENCKAHIQTHLDDRQYKCPYQLCGKLFVRSHDLRRHLRTHDVHKKWVCPCGRDFSRADALHRHQGRGNCIGAPPGTKRKEPAKRGRPPKKKDIEESAVHVDIRAAPVTPIDLSQPPQPHGDGSQMNNNDANFAPMGGHEFDNNGFDEDIIGLGKMCGLPDFATDPSPSPTHSSHGVAPSPMGGLAPSPLEEELSSSPMAPYNDLLEPTGDEWFDDLIFINDDHFIDGGEV